MSVRLSTTCARACSGLMYAAVPRIIPRVVRVAVASADESGAHLGQSEVQHLHHAVRLDLDVAWFQIPMNHAFFVRGFECVGDLFSDSKCLLQRNRSLLDALGQR